MTAQSDVPPGHKKKAVLYQSGLKIGRKQSFRHVLVGNGTQESADRQRATAGQRAGETHALDRRMLDQRMADLGPPCRGLADFAFVRGSDFIFFHCARKFAPVDIPGIEEFELGFDIAALAF